MKKLLCSLVVTFGLLGEVSSREESTHLMSNNKEVRDFITYNDQFYYEYPEQLQTKLMVEGDSCDLTQIEKNNEFLVDTLSRAKAFKTPISLKIDNAIIPNSIFNYLDQMYYLELNNPLIYADDDTFECLFDNLKRNSTLKSLILRNPRLYTGLGTNNVSRYYDGLEVLYQMKSISVLLEALQQNKTLVNLSLLGGLFYEEIRILQDGLDKHASLKNIRLEEEDLNLDDNNLAVECKCCCTLF